MIKKISEGVRTMPDAEAFRFIQSTLGIESIASTHSIAGTPESPEGQAHHLQRAIQTDARFGTYGSQTGPELQRQLMSVTALNELFS